MRCSRTASVGLAAVLLVGAAPARGQVDRPIIAVFNIEDRGLGLSRATLSRMSVYLGMQLAATGAYQIVPRDKLRAELSKQKVSSYKQCYDQSCQIQIGRELAAQKSLATSIIKLGSRCMVTALVYDLQRATSEGGASVEGKCDEDGIVSSIQALVSKLVLRGQVSSPKARRSKERGGVLIKTTPPGAQVKIDGAAVRGQTPITIADLPAGEHLLEIEKGDYRHTGKIRIRADDYVTVDVTLRKALVRLEVVSDPPEATIILNGMEMGRTPRVLPSLRAGRHVIELRRTGYLPERTAIRLGAGTGRQSLRLTLKRAATLVVRSMPPDAQVHVDGALAGTTPLAVPVAPGPRKVRVALAGRVPVERIAAAVAGEQVTLALTLELTAAERRRLAEAQEQRRARSATELRYQAALAAHEREHGADLRRRRSKAIRGWTALGAGAALAVTAAVLFGVGVSQGEEAHAAYREATDRAPPPSLAVVDELRSDVEGARAKVAAGGVLLGMGAAAAGFAVYQLLTRPAVPEAPAREAFAARLSLAPCAVGGALVLGGRF